MSQTSDKVLTPDGPVKVLGYRIKVQASSPPDSNEGLYAISLSDGSELKFPTQIRNMPAELIYLAPTLNAGTYKLEVRSYANGSGTSKNLKVIHSDVVLTVS